MGMDVVAIKPGHNTRRVRGGRDEYGECLGDGEDEEALRAANPLERPELFDDPWYAPSGEHGPRHPIWKAWRSGHADASGQAELPTALALSIPFPTDRAGALDTAGQIDAFCALHRRGGQQHHDHLGELESYARWLRHWAGKGAAFHTSC